MTTEPEDYMVWLDLETTGLDPRTCKILEIATIVTNYNLETIEEGPNIIVHQPDDVLDNMNDWCLTQHTKTGLLEASRASDIVERDAEMQVYDFMARYQKARHQKAPKPPMCGNTIGFDRAFLCEHMPLLEGAFHYRNVDVSTVKMLVRNWYPDLPLKDAEGRSAWAVGHREDDRHRALRDIRTSISELKLYRKAVFVQPGSAKL